MIKILLITLLFSSYSYAKVCELSHTVTGTDIGVLFQEDIAPTFQTNEDIQIENFEFNFPDNKKQVSDLSKVVIKKIDQGDSILFELNRFKKNQTRSNATYSIVLSKENTVGSIGSANDLFESTLHISCFN